MSGNFLLNLSSTLSWVCPSDDCPLLQTNLMNFAGPRIPTIILPSSLKNKCACHVFSAVYCLQITKSVQPGPSRTRTQTPQGNHRDSINSPNGQRQGLLILLYRQISKAFRKALGKQGEHVPRLWTHWKGWISLKLMGKMMLNHGDLEVPVPSTMSTAKKSLVSNKPFLGGS
jgi:hypothetical protein